MHKMNDLLEVSDQFSDITIIVEFFRWTIQLETSLHFLLKLLFNFYEQEDCTQTRFGHQI